MEITKNSKITIILVGIMMAVLLAGCSSKTTTSSSANTTSLLKSTVEIGNTNGNNLNGGLVCEKGDWIYYSNSSDMLKLYRMRTDGSGKQKLSDDATCNINVVGDWVYYHIAGTNGTTYRIMTDGSGRHLLSNDCFEGSIVVGAYSAA